MIIVTGASSGVGRAVARAAGKQGACVALIARGRDGLEAAAREIESAGGKSLVLPLDVADAGAVAAAADFVVDTWGCIDAWVNNAMVSVLAPIKVTMLQLPAVNTPQFEVVRNKLGRHARPVPPTYQPEVIASAVLHAIQHPSREMWIGWPRCSSTCKAIVALARFAFATPPPASFSSTPTAK